MSTISRRSCDRLDIESSVNRYHWTFSLHLKLPVPAGDCIEFGNHMKLAQRNVFEKILLLHGIEDDHTEIHIFPDQILTQDATATPVFLQVETIGIERVKPLVVNYVDHNTLQTDHKNQDDHIYLQGMARMLGLPFSKAGNGICHQVHLERFVIPGDILIGSDSHTPTAGGVAMMAIGAGGLDIAAAIAGEPFVVPRPKVVGIHLRNRLRRWSSAKDIILYLLARVKVNGGVGKVFEYFGDGVRGLSVYERSTICNMGAEMGLTTSLFLSDDATRDFFASFGRVSVWRELLPDKNCSYDDIIEVDLAEIEPLVACPHSPDNVVSVSEVEGTEIEQVVIGSCTNSSYKDMFIAASILKGRRIADHVSLVVSPGSQTILAKMCETGIIKDFIDAGARILETTCGPCNGIGQAPASGTNSLRTHNRNYLGRSGTMSASVYLSSSETAATSALYGRITDPRRMADYPEIPREIFMPGNSLLILPPGPDKNAVIFKGPNIKPVPLTEPLSGAVEMSVVLKLGDNVTTDDILPGGARMLDLRSNVPDSIPFAFSRVRPDFGRLLDKLPPRWLLVGGDNFGQGSSREHAVMVPLAAGMRLVLAKSFARIYRKNLINYGILPLTFVDQDDYAIIGEGDSIVIKDIEDGIVRGIFTCEMQGRGSIIVSCSLTPRESDIIRLGGLMNLIKASMADLQGRE